MRFSKVDKEAQLLSLYWRKAVAGDSFSLNPPDDSDPRHWISLYAEVGDGQAVVGALRRSEALEGEHYQRAIHRHWAVGRLQAVDIRVVDVNGWATPAYHALRRFSELVKALELCTREAERDPHRANPWTASHDDVHTTEASHA